jgi:hypothetical protein
MKPIFYDSLIIACVCADIGLMLFLINEIAILDLNILFLFLIPVVIFAVSVIFSQRKSLFPKKPPIDQLSQAPLFSEELSIPEESKIVGEKKPFKPSPAPKARVEFEMHNCPEHGPERCAGNYMNLHSCNFASANATQIYWEEKSKVVPRKQKKVNNAAFQ